MYEIGDKVVNQKLMRFPDEFVPRYKSPIAAVITIVAIIAHDKVVAVGHHDIADSDRAV